MPNKATPKKAQIRYPDSIQIDGGRLVRLSSLNPESTIRIQGHRIPVKLIRRTDVVLKCGDTFRGIELAVGDLVFCDKHQSEQPVVKVTAEDRVEGR